MKKNSIVTCTLFLVFLATVSARANENAVAAAERENCEAVYTKLLVGFVESMDAGRALDAKADFTQMVELLDTEDLNQGSYDLKRIVQVRAMGKDGTSPVVVTMLTSGDYYCSDERIVKIRSIR